MAKKSIFTGIIWNRRCDGSYGVYDSYTGKTYYATPCVGGKYALYGVTKGVQDRMTRLEIAQYIDAQR